MADQRYFPTKGNLLALKKSHALATMGYELMDRKRNVLIREMMSVIQNARVLRDELGKAYKQAYMALQEANISLGVVGEIAKAIPIDEGLGLSFRSIMGVDIPKVFYEKKEVRVTYGIGSTNTKFDFAVVSFRKVRDLTIQLAETDNSAYRLANAIRKSQKQANALKSIVIPEYEANIKIIADALEERDREEFSRNKIVKKKLSEEPEKNENV